MQSCSTICAVVLTQRGGGRPAADRAGCCVNALQPRSGSVQQLAGTAGHSCATAIAALQHRPPPCARQIRCQTLRMRPSSCWSACNGYSSLLPLQWRQHYNLQPLCGQAVSCLAAMCVWYRPEPKKAWLQTEVCAADHSGDRQPGRHEPGRLRRRLCCHAGRLSRALCVRGVLLAVRDLQPTACKPGEFECHCARCLNSKP